MGVSVVRDGYRVEVFVHIPPWEDHARALGRCRRIQEQIERHVDGFADTTVTWDQTTRCDFCGHDPEPDRRTGEPACCGAAVEEWEANQPAEGQDASEEERREEEDGP